LRRCPQDCVVCCLFWALERALVACSDSADIDNGMLVCLQVSLNLKCAASKIILFCCCV